MSYIKGNTHRNWTLRTKLNEDDELNGTQGMFGGRGQQLCDNKILSDAVMLKFEIPL